MFFNNPEYMAYLKWIHHAKAQRNFDYIQPFIKALETITSKGVRKNFLSIANVLYHGLGVNTQPYP